MRLSDHLGKGIWGIADKGLPVLYGVAYVALVIRVLPMEEFGNFTLIQEIFLIVSGLATGFALQPMLKFASEEGTDHKAVLTSAVLMNLAFVLLSSLIIVTFRMPLSNLFNSPNLAPLMLYLPAMFAASFIRNFTLVLLQTRFLVKQIFWVDAMHFVGTPALIYLYSKLHIFDSAVDLISISIMSLSASSLLGLILSRRLLRFSPSVHPESMKAMWDYGKYSMGGLVSYMVYAKSDTLILSSFGGPVQVAVYNSVKVFTRVFDMLSQIVNMFVLPATSRFASRDEFRTLKAVVEKALTFTTVGMLPVFFLFLALASPLVNIIYQGRYGEAIPLLQIFSFLSFIVPAIAVASNTLLGLGRAKESFLLSIQILVGSLIIYLLFIPWLGATGATIGYVVSSFVLAWITISKMKTLVPVTLGELWRRTDDIKVFLQSRLNK